MNKCKNIAIALLLIILFFPNINLAQPYYFEQGNITNSYPSYNLYEIDRINLSNGISNIFLYNGFEELAFDQTQTWVANGWNDENYIYYYLDTTNYFNIDPFDSDILFSQSKNMIYIFCWDTNRTDKQLAVYDVSKKQKVAFLNLPINSDLWDVAFFSSDENTIYFPIQDSAVNNTKIAYYSVNNNQIVQLQELSSLGYKNVDGYYLHKGRQGTGIIESYIKNQTKDSYYNVYNLDNNIGSNFILHSGNAEPFISQDCKYLLLAEQSLDTLSENTAQFYNTGVLKIYNVANNSFIKTLTYPARGTFFMSDSYPADIYYIGPKNNRIIRSINIDSLVQQTYLPVKLMDSHGINITTGSLQYYDSTWQNALNNNDGTFLVNTTLKKVNLKMTYANSTQTMNNVPVVSDTVVFKTVNTSVQLIDSRGNPFDTGTVQYYAGAWRSFGTTANGIANMELLPNSYKFRMTYKYVSEDTTQNTGISNVVNFSTVLCTISVKDSLGQPVNNADTKYYAGAWREIGLTSGGIAAMELLPVNLSFRVKSGKTQLDMTQNLAVNNVVQFILP